MGTSERRERERQAVRRKILDAARSLFAEHGYDAVTMRRIADKIEYSPTALYFHFADKESLLRALCEDDFRALAAQFLRIGKIADPVERLRKAGLAYLEFALDHPQQYRLMFMTPSPVKPTEALSIQQGNPEEDAYAFLRWTVGEAIAQKRMRPELKDVELAAQACWAAVHGVASLHIAKAGSDWIALRPARATARTVVDALMRGMLREE